MTKILTETANVKTIDGVLADIKNKGVTKTNLYNVTIDFPHFNGKWEDYIGMAGAEIGREMIIPCESVSFPPKTIDTDTTFVGRNEIRLAKRATYDTVQLSFRCSADMREKKVFDAWLATIVGSKSGNLEYPDVYRREMRIEILAQNSNTVKLKDSVKPSGIPSEQPFLSDFFNKNFSGVFGNNTSSAEPNSLKVIDGKMYVSYMIVLKECFPISISCTQLSYGSQSEVMHVDVMFACTRALNSLEEADEAEEFSTSQTTFNTTPQPSPFSDGNGVAPLSRLDSMKAKITQARNIMTDTKTTIIGLSGLGQGETLNIYNKLNSIVEGYTGISIGDGVRMVRETRDDIKAIKDTNVLAADNKNALLAGANNLLDVL